MERILLASRIGGSTLIELIIVIAIIGILSSVAIPRYQQFVMKAKITDAILSARRLKYAVIEYHAINGGFSGLPDDNNPNQTLKLLGLSQNWFGNNSPSVKNMWWHTGSGQVRISMTKASGLDGKRLILQSNFGNGQSSWSCGTTAAQKYQIPLEYLPSNCQNFH